MSLSFSRHSSNDNRMSLDPPVQDTPKERDTGTPVDANDQSRDTGSDDIAEVELDDNQQVIAPTNSRDPLSQAISTFSEEFSKLTSDSTSGEILIAWNLFLRVIFPEEDYKVRHVYCEHSDSDRIEVYEHDQQLDEAGCEKDKLYRELMANCKSKAAEPHRLLSKRETDRLPEGLGEWPSAKNLGFGNSGFHPQMPFLAEDWKDFLQTYETDKKEREEKIKAKIPRKQWISKVWERFDPEEFGKHQEELAEEDGAGNETAKKSGPKKSGSRKAAAKKSGAKKPVTKKPGKTAEPREEDNEEDNDIVMDDDDDIPEPAETANPVKPGLVPIFLIEIRSERSFLNDSADAEFVPQTLTEAGEITIDEPEGQFPSTTQQDIIRHIREDVAKESMYGVPNRLYCATAIGKRVQFWMYDVFNDLKLAQTSPRIHIQHDPDGYLKDMLLAFHLINCRLWTIKSCGWELQSGLSVSIDPWTGILKPFGNDSPYMHDNLRRYPNILGTGVWSLYDQGQGEGITILRKTTKDSQGNDVFEQLDGSKGGPLKRYGYFNPGVSTAGHWKHMKMYKQLYPQDWMANDSKLFKEYMQLIQDYSVKMGFHYGEPWLDDPTYVDDWKDIPDPVIRFDFAKSSNLRKLLQDPNQPVLTTQQKHALKIWTLEDEMKKKKLEWPAYA